MEGEDEEDEDDGMTLPVVTMAPDFSDGVYLIFSMVILELEPI